MAERERETIITTTTGDRGSGAKVAIILGLIALLVVLYLAFGEGLTGADTTDIKADIDVGGPATDGKKD